MRRKKNFHSEMTRILIILAMVLFCGLFSEVQAIGEGYLSPDIPNDGNYYVAVDSSDDSGIQPFVIPQDVQWTVIKVALSIDADPSNTPDFRMYQNPLYVATFDNPGDRADIFGEVSVRITNVEWLDDSNLQIITFHLDHTQWREDGVTSDEEWQIEIKNNDTDPRKFFIGIGHSSITDNETLAINEATANAEIPWIEVKPDPVDFGEVLLGGYEQTQTLEIANVGTGDLTLNDPTLSHTAFTFDATGSTDPYTVPPLTYLNDPNPNQIQFDPTDPNLPPTLGPLNETATFTNAPHQPDIVVNLPVTLVKLEVGLLFDISRSMGWRDDGTKDSTMIEDDTRLYKAKLAGREIRELLEGLEGDKVRGALFTFPEYSVRCPSAGTVIAFDDFTSINSTLIDAFSRVTVERALRPGGLTPMAKGLEIAYGIPPDNFGTGNWTQGDYIRRALILLSDGAHNCPKSGYATEPLDEPSEWEVLIENVTDPIRWIRVFTIGYGIRNTSHVDHAVLTDLADAGKGEMFVANSLDTDALKEAFRNALINANNWASILDPDSTLTKGGPTKYHNVYIDDNVHRIAFLVDWEKIAPDVIRFELEGPDGIVSASSTDVSYHSDVTYAMYIVGGKTAIGHKGSDKWTFKLSGGQGLDSGESVNYSYSVIGKSKVKISLMSEEETFNTGKDRLFEIKIDGLTRKMAKSVDVTLEYDIPKNSFANWLSIMKDFDPHWLIQPQQSKPHAPETIMGEMANMLQRKAYSLRNFANKFFKDIRAKGTLQLHDDGINGDKAAGDRIYSAYLPTLNRDGTAKFSVFLQDNSNENSRLKRELRIDKLIRINLNPQILVKNVKYLFPKISAFFPRGIEDIINKLKKEHQVRSIEFTPKDDFGNRMGPGKADRIKFKLKNADPVGDVVDNMDGTYIQVIKFKKGVVPSVIVTAMGVSSPEIKLKPFAGVRWGLKAGINYADFKPSGSDAPNLNWKIKKGFIAGPFVAFYLYDNLAIQPELLYSQEGFKVENAITDTYAVDFVQIPLLLKFNLSPSALISPYLFSGLFAAFKVRDEIPANTAIPPIKNFNYGFTVGGGLGINLGSSTTLLFEVRFCRGIPNIADMPPGSDMTVKSKVLSFMIGIEF